MFNVLLNEIPLAEASSFFIRLRDFEKTADENNVASSEYAPPDESGRFEGQFTVPVEAALKLMSEMLANELKTMYAYKVYANSLRDLTHHSIAEEFEDHADQELEHADFLMRRMAILGGPVQGPDIVAPPPSTDPKDIVQRMIRIEQEGIERWKKLHSITGDNPTKYKIEEFMTREQEHLDELWQLVPHSAPPVLTHGGTTSSTFSPPELPPSAPDTMPTPPDYKTAAWRKIAQMPGGLPPTAMGQQSAPTPPMPLTGGAAGQQSMPSPPSPLSGPAAGENMKMAFAKFAKKEEKGLSPSTKAMLGLPLLGAASGAAIMGLSGIGRAGTGSALSNAGRGLATGAAFGTAASALIGMGKLLEKADPSGRTLRTVVELAPAAIAVGGAIRDSREEERRSKHAEKQDADQVAAGRARAIANLSSGFTSDENTRGERAGDLIGRLTGAGGGGAAGYRMMRGQGPAL
jgi:bacterioferritin